MATKSRLTACAVWKLSEGGYRWVRRIVEELDRDYEQIDFDYRPEKGTVWASRRLQSAEISTKQILEAMLALADAYAEGMEADRGGGSRCSGSGSGSASGSTMLGSART